MQERVCRPLEAPPSVMIPSFLNLNQRKSSDPEGLHESPKLSPLRFNQSLPEPIESDERKEIIVLDTHEIEIQGDWTFPLRWGTFIVLESLFLSLGGIAQSRPISIKVSLARQTAVKAAFTILSIAWQTCLQNGTGGTGRQAPSFQSASKTFRVAFVLSLIMIALTGIATASVTISTVTLQKPTDINIANLAVYFGYSLPLLTQRAARTTRTEQLEGAVFKYKPQQNWIIPLPSIDDAFAGDQTGMRNINLDNIPSVPMRDIYPDSYFCFAPLVSLLVCDPQLELFTTSTSSETIGNMPQDVANLMISAGLIDASSTPEWPINQNTTVDWFLNGISAKIFMPDASFDPSKSPFVSPMPLEQINTNLNAYFLSASKHSRMDIDYTTTSKG
ncbi:hypothetical protein BDQ17DRAFT_1328881 [Cyathus striatus]|nr:hypothetical protein BDQ17DRAFT_1328881 [Cyathus striatus]